MATNPQAREEAAVNAKRALLREQVRLLGHELPWLSDPSRIPTEAVKSSADKPDVADQYFHLAAWVVREIVLAASRLQQQLKWEETFSLYNVPLDLTPRIRRAVLEPATRYAPGMLALAEIVAAIPVVATRETIPLRDWERIARNAQAFGAKISCDGTHVQVLIRNYLRKTPEPTGGLSHRVLDTTLLRPDDQMGVTSITPIDDLVSAARNAVKRHIGPARGMCVAMQAKAPGCQNSSPTRLTMYAAIWSAYSVAATRLIFPNVDLRSADIPLPKYGPDPRFAAAIDELARQRATDLSLR
jgi:hypothetical protein